MGGSGKNDQADEILTLNNWREEETQNSYLVISSDDGKTKHN